MKPFIAQEAGQLVAASVLANLATQTTLGVTWPANAEFCMVTKFSTWPCGWNKNLHVDFFDSLHALEEEIKRKQEWSLCEDNYFAMRVYAWDWGPQHCAQYDHDAQRIPTSIHPDYQSDVFSGDDWRMQEAQRRLYAHYAARVRMAVAHKSKEIVIASPSQDDEPDNIWF